MTVMTSVSHPLRIAEASVRSGGRIGLTFCPGKKQRHAASGSWDRDLDLDLDAIRAWGAGAVVTLVEQHELRELGVEDMPRAVDARGMSWHHLPIKDVSVPDGDFEVGYGRIRDDIHRRLAEGRAVLVHCKGGLGRAGLVAARLLVEAGHEPEEAIELVRKVRPGAIETPEQEAYVRARAPFAA